MAVTRTRAELVNRIMKVMNLLMPGEAPSARDSADILERYDDILEELRDEKTVYWESNLIPQEVFEALAQLMVICCAGMFGFPAPTGEELTMAIDGAKRRIKAKVVKPASQLETPNTYM